MVVAYLKAKKLETAKLNQQKVKVGIEYKKFYSIIFNSFNYQSQFTLI